MTNPMVRSGALLLLMAILIVPAAGQKSPTNWPGFRGVDAAGTAEGFPLPAVWDAPASRNVLWKTPIPGLGHSSPIIWGNRLFVATAVSGSAKQDLKVGLYGQSGDLGRGHLLSHSIQCRRSC